jgi:hypothetical protein
LTVRSMNVISLPLSILLTEQLTEEVNLI